MLGRMARKVISARDGLVARNGPCTRSDQNPWSRSGGFLLFDESLKIRNKYWAITVCSHKKLAGFYRDAIAVKNFSFIANLYAEHVAANFL